MALVCTVVSTLMRFNSAGRIEPPLQTIWLGRLRCRRHTGASPVWWLALEAIGEKRLLLAGHHDKQMTGPLGDQENLLGPMKAAYPGRLHATLVRVGNYGDSPEITLRG
jgi:hypothetical protein